MKKQLTDTGGHEKALKELIRVCIYQICHKNITTVQLSIPKIAEKPIS